MARKKKPLEPIDDKLRLALAGAVANSGYSHAAIAERVGLSQNRISTILRGDTPPASLGELALIARMLGLSISELVGQAEDALGATAFDWRTGRPASRRTPRS